MGGSMGSHPQTEEVMDDKGLLLMNFSYKSLTLRLYNELHQKNPMYVPGISDTRRDFGELSVVRK